MYIYSINAIVNDNRVVYKGGCMSKTCEDCGTTLRSGICTNCMEELYINDYQMPENPIEVSDEWNETVSKQRIKLKDTHEQTHNI